MPRFIPALGGVAVVVVAAAVLALTFEVVSGPGATPTPSPTPSAQPTPPVGPDVSAVLNNFLSARVAGSGAQQYLGVPEAEVPLLYATSSGAAYERADFSPVVGYTWPRNRIAYLVRLYAGSTVVEQLFFYWSELGSNALGYLPDGFATNIPATTENGKPVAWRYSTLDGQVTLEVAHPWVATHWDARPWDYVQTLISLVPAGQVSGTQDGLPDDWGQFGFTPDPTWVSTDCVKGPSGADAASLAASILSDAGLSASAPVNVRVGGADALMLEVTIPAGAPLCVPAGPGGDFNVPVGLLTSVFDQNGPWDFDPDALTFRGVATGNRLRLYLIDAPDALSMHTLAVAIRAPYENFEHAIEAAPSVLNTLEFHAP